MNTITLRTIAFTDPVYQQVWQLREDVLRKPLGLSLANEDLSGEKNDIVFAAFEDEKVVGCIMLRPVDDDLAKLRQMAVSYTIQGTGVGRMLMVFAEEWAWDHGFKKVTLHARRTAEGFYEKIGYKVTGSEFEEVGIPHVTMEKHK